MPITLTPLLNVADVAQSVAFYRDLGFEVTGRFEDAGELVWVSLAAGEARLMLNRKDRITSEQRLARPHYGDLVLYLDVPSAHQMHAELSARGVTVGPVERQAYGVDEFCLRDPDGYELAIMSAPATT